MKNLDYELVKTFTSIVRAEDYRLLLLSVDCSDEALNKEKGE